MFLSQILFFALFIFSDNIIDLVPYMYVGYNGGKVIHTRDAVEESVRTRAGVEESAYIHET
jgi:hypothetical protein